MDSLWLQIIAILVLVLANGFFALSEFSVIASRKSRLKQKVAEGKSGAAAAEKIRANPDRFLATIQVGITLFGTLAGVFGGATIVVTLEQLLRNSPIEVVSDGARPIAVALISVAITITSVVLGELVPKYIALSNPERYARYVANPILVFIRIAWFFSWILTALANLVLRILGIRRDSEGQAVTEDEINLMIFEGKQSGVFDETEEQLVRNVFDFADSTVRRAMTPRTDVVGLPLDGDPAQVIAVVIDNGYSRYPVYEGSLDRIVGILHTRDLVLHRLNAHEFALRDLIRKPVFVPDSLPLARLLRDFQRKKNKFAVVLDEFGGTAGIVTLEDILEQLVGEILDEDERGELPLVRHSESVAYADGAVRPGAVNVLMDARLPEDRAETLAGLVIDHLGHLPSKDDSVIIGDMKITVLELADNRLQRLKLERLAVPTA
ncbi:MAG TPA: hemolysin family protein [candidate division Zixibacteria bacterium]|nr:HlyC/CorC family transporter [candidate division Zixibacteria bacterium]MDD4916733.1 hemolysin family protein [candidate division Zixibacteria bacterium]MDM7973826.1 hemolysin family protein [candidate division Zixibacteria bacterium]HOD65371.1 hemolysin family protein [candidate division Zixibacteria bacterium]HPM37973.1 hemolysin family protein [candidate division Zixibacteria bacterium]